MTDPTPPRTTGAGPVHRPAAPDADAADLDMRRYYAERAREYDRIYAKPERQPDLRAIGRWLPGVLAGRRVLELACGTGYWTRVIAPAAASTVALDAAAETLSIARAREGCGGVRFVVGDAYRLPFAPARFDAAFAGFWYSHVPRARVDAFLRGLHRVLVPGARVVLLDNRYVPGSSTPVGAPDEQGDTWQRRVLDDGSVHRVLKNFPDDDTLRGALDALAADLRPVRWAHYWALAYSVGPTRATKGAAT